MKRIILFYLGIAICLSACKKSENDEAAVPATPPAAAAIGPVPATFTQKVMVEENTGAWCGWCPLGTESIKKAEDLFPGRMNAVALHGGSNEPMTVPEYAAMATFCATTSVPHYQLNRGIGGGFPGSFSSKVNTAMAQVATCGLAIDARESSGSSVSFTVHAGFNAALTGDYRLMVYLVEDSVSKSASNYNQVNYVAGDPNYTTSYYYSQPDPILNYPHRNVARKLLSASLIGGDQIPAANIVAGGKFTKKYTFTIPAGTVWSTTRLSAVAGILKYDATCANQKIMNSQKVKLGSLKNWD